MDLDKLILCQLDKVEKIQKSQTNFAKSPKSRITHGYIEARLEYVEHIWEVFNSTHDEIIKSVDKDKRKCIAYFTKETYYECEEIYLNFKGELKTKLKEISATTTPPHTSQVNSSHTELKLPSINIPTFTGKYTEWQSFHDIYESLIHNNTKLDNVQKLHYLKTSLSGEAETLLRSIAVTHNNYTLAWETLKKRYNNKRYISNCIFKKLFSLKPLSVESEQSIKQLLDVTSECISSLSNLGLPTQSWDAIIVYLTVTKLDADSHRLWEQTISDFNDFPTLENLFNFLEKRFRSLEMIEYKGKAVKTKSFHSSRVDAEKTLSCSFCKENHYIYQCKDFSKQDYKDKQTFVQNNKLCYNCLIPNHSVLQCKRNTRCRVCQKKHHSLLHPEKRDCNETPQALAQEVRQADEHKTVSHHTHNPGQVLLATALVDIMARNGQMQVYRALLDQGSQTSFVTEEFVQATGLRRCKSNCKFHLSEGKTMSSRYTVEFELKSRYRSNFTLQIQAYVLSHITTYLPQKYINSLDWPEIESITLADPNFRQPGKVDMLLGASVTSKIMEEGLFRSPVGTLAQKTQLGWIISGDTNTTIENNRIISMHSCVCENNMLKQFWEIENEFLTTERRKTKEEERCEDIYKTTTTRTESGRYKVHLPFKDSIQTPLEKCGKTKEIATARFLKLEKRFKYDKHLKEEYKKVIKEYQELGHMALANEESDHAIYLPHHPVIREDKDTTKVRVVFDASCKGTGGSSLNDTLLIGPTLQSDLRVLLMKWRKHRIVLVADIVKMYRQVLIADEHAEYQHIVWRDNPEDSCKAYKLLTVTFGTASAPYLAVRTLLQLAEDEKHQFPIAAEIVKESFYMDDLMLGCSNTSEALEAYRQLTQLLKRGGFELQKWSSNHDEVLNIIAERKSQHHGFEIKFDQIIKILGLSWDRHDDKFKFTVSLPDIPSQITKRNILSDVARLFDPFGWLAPTIILAKILIQKLWLCNAEWDEQLPQDLTEEWLTYRKQLQQLQDIKIDRWLHIQPDCSLVQLHGFADASTVAYSAVLYIRVVNEDGVTVTLLESKTKVAPLKQVSVARLELCAAVLVARMLSEAREVLNIPKNNVYAYTDSMVVLAWIQSPPVRWQTFVANRVAEIQGRLDNDRWCHVKSEMNPADLASRGVAPSELRSKTLWWLGPQWLSNNEIEQNKPHILQTELEQRKQKIKVFNCNIEDNIINRFSTFNRMIRVLTYCRRFIYWKRNKNNNKQFPSYLSAAELQQTLLQLIKVEQEKQFKEEIIDITKQGQVKKRSSLRKLSPYLEQDLLRVGGRLQDAKVPQEIKHPIILPKNSRLTHLLIRDAHLKLLHGGNLLTTNYIRSRYWVIGLKSLVKKCIHQCVTCLRHRARIKQPIMGNLPAQRVHPGRPFETSGVDYAGPIQIRTSRGRGHKSYKGYICLFICFATKAVHLEAVSDLSTQGFLAAFRRFVARRGHCAHLWSDNGTNFVGAAKELEFLYKTGSSGLQPQIAELMANDGTTWHFIPPRAPNFGGLWEAGIKSVKTHLLRVLGNTTLTFEEMTTLLAQIEACLNSRPICELNDDPNDVAALTPSHFLIGEPLVAIPEKLQTNFNITPLDRWKLVRKISAHFWQRWSVEYLHSLQQRHKWNSKTKAPEKGDIVLIKEPALPPTKWLLARVLETHPGQDGEVRVVSLQAKSGLLKRPVSKLVAISSH